MKDKIRMYDILNTIEIFGKLKKNEIEDLNYIRDYINNLQEENEKLKKDLKTLWNVCWNNDTEMTSYQNEVFDNYYDMFHKNGGDEECNLSAKQDIHTGKLINEKILELLIAYKKIDI